MQLLPCHAWELYFRKYFTEHLNSELSTLCKYNWINHLSKLIVIIKISLEGLGRKSEFIQNKIPTQIFVGVNIRNNSCHYCWVFILYMQMSYQEHTMSICPITGGINFITWLRRWLPSVFFSVKLLFFCLKLINTYGKMLWHYLSILLPLKSSPISFTSLDDSCPNQLLLW